MNESVRVEYIRRLETLQVMREKLPDQTDQFQMNEAFIRQLAFFITSKFEKDIIELLEASKID